MLLGISSLRLGRFGPA